MAQVWTTKQQNWVQRFSNNVVGLLANIDALNELCSEYTTNTYGTGGANQIADATVQLVLPAATAAFVSSAVGVFANSGGINSLLATGGTDRASLENMRP